MVSPWNGNTSRAGARARKGHAQAIHERAPGPARKRGGARDVGVFLREPFGLVLI